MSITKRPLVNLLLLASVVSATSPAVHSQEVKSGKPAAAESSSAKSRQLSDKKSTLEWVETANDADGTAVTVAEKPEQSGTVDESEAQESESNAAKEAQTALNMATNESLEHYDLARYYWSRWNLKMAELEYQASIMYYPEMKVSHRDFCLLSLFTGHPMRAMAELMMVVDLGEPIAWTEEEKADFKKRAAKLHNEQGIAYGRKNRWDRAISEFKWALAYSPDNAAIERSLAFSYANKGDFEMAERSYTRSFSEDPTDGYSHADFAFLLADNGGGEKALQQLSQAVKLEPRDPALHVDMGWMAESKGDLSTAQTEFQQAVKLSPKHAGLWAHLGRVFEREGKAKEASAAYSEAIALDPGQDDAKERLDQLKNRQSEVPQSPTSVDDSRKQS